MMILVWLFLWVMMGQPTVYFNPLNGWAVFLIIMIVWSLK